MTNTQQLMQPLDFTPDDIQANRQGELGAYQRDRLAALQRRALLIGGVGFVAFAFIASIFLYLGQVNGTLILTLLGIFVILINAIFVGMFGRQWMRLQADLRTNAIEVIEGQLERVVRATGRVNNFVLRVDGVDFPVKKETFKLFQHDQPYRMYRAPHSRVLLAAEPAS